jgi:hypothetical protein
VHSPTDISGPLTKSRQQDSVCKSSNKIDDGHESAEADRQREKSSSSGASTSCSSSSSNNQQQHHCTICNVTLHNSGSQQTHLSSKAHRTAEQVYTRGMQAAIEYMVKCLPVAPAPPSAAVAAALVPAPLSPLSCDYLSIALNPALRALVEGLQQHEDGLAWRSFLRAVAAGCGAVDQWQRHLPFIEDAHCDDCVDEDGDDLDDEADVYEF